MREWYAQQVNPTAVNRSVTCQTSNSNHMGERTSPAEQVPQGNELFSLGQFLGVSAHIIAFTPVLAEDVSKALVFENCPDSGHRHRK